MSSKTDEPLNILLITSDQWRGDCLPGQSGGMAPRTPFLDDFARESTRFAQHYTQAYPCGPARAGLITGLYPHKHRSIRNGTPLDARHRTIFQEARRAGYRPRLYGYTDTTADPRLLDPADPAVGDYEGVAPGLEVGVLLTESAKPWLAHLKRRGYDVPSPDEGRDGIFDQRGFGQPALFEAQDSETAFLTDCFLSDLAVQGSKPFFTHISYIAPHPPFAVAEPYFSAYDPADQPMPISHEGVEDQHPLIRELRQHVEIGHFVPGISGPVCTADEAMIRQVRAIYAGLCTEVDFHLGRIIAALKAANLYDRTLIIMSGDHGEQLFDHGLLGKLAYFDQSAHIPLMIRDPRAGADATRGKVITEFTQTIDLLPTVLDALGLQPPANVDGASLMPLIAGHKAKEARDAAFWSTDFAGGSSGWAERTFGLPSELCNLHVVRTERFKYVRFAGMAPVLFDLVNDPLETQNRAGDPAYAALEREGLERLLDLRLRHEERTLTSL